MAEHLLVLRCLLSHRLYVKTEKFLGSQFLGYRIILCRVGMDEKKVKTVFEWPEPQTVKELQRFLGFTNFYHKQKAAPIQCDLVSKIEHIGYPKCKTLVPEPFKTQVIEWALTMPAVGHPKFQKTTKALVHKCWWPNLGNVAIAIRSCSVCGPSYAASQEMNAHPVPQRPWSYLATDFVMDPSVQRVHHHLGGGGSVLERGSRPAIQFRSQGPIPVSVFALRHLGGYSVFSDIQFVFLNPEPGGRTWAWHQSRRPFLCSIAITEMSFMFMLLLLVNPPFLWHT